MAHRLVEREGAQQFFDAPEEGALAAGGRVEHALRHAEVLDGRLEQVGGDDLAVHGEGDVGVHLRDDVQREVAGVEDFGGGVERGDGLAALLKQNQFVQFALDRAVHFASVGARQAWNAGVAQPVLVEVHERVHRGVQRVVAEETQRVGATHFALGAVEDAE